MCSPPKSLKYIFHIRVQSDFQSDLRIVKIQQWIKYHVLVVCPQIDLNISCVEQQVLAAFNLLDKYYTESNCFLITLWIITFKHCPVSGMWLAGWIPVMVKRKLKLSHDPMLSNFVKMQLALYFLWKGFSVISWKKRMSAFATFLKSFCLRKRHLRKVHCCFYCVYCLCIVVFLLYYSFYITTQHKWKR